MKMENSKKCFCNMHLICPLENETEYLPVSEPIIVGGDLSHQPQIYLAGVIWILRLVM